MKKTALLIFLAPFAFAIDVELNSFSANFTQKVEDDQKKVLSYSGIIKASKPNSLYWHYQKPIDKEIIIKKTEVIVIEPELEQVIFKSLGQEISLFKIIKEAKALSKTEAKATFDEIDYFIKHEGNKLIQLSYIDKYENRVEINFTKQIVNKKIDAKYFIPHYPSDFDQIIE